MSKRSSCNYASLTILGKAFIDQNFPQHEKKLEEIFEQLKDDDLNKMIELRKQLSN